MNPNFALILNDADDETMHVDPGADRPSDGVIHAHRALGPDPKFDPAEAGEPAYKCKMPSGGKIYVRAANVASGPTPLVETDDGEVRAL
jgi:hypothetical protein